MKRIIFSLLLFSFFFTATSQVVTVNEGFENWPPLNWEIYENGVALDGWIQDWQGISHSGEHSAYNDIDNAQCDNWLVSPQISVTSSDYTLRYWDLNGSPEYYDKVSILVSTNSGVPTDGDFIEVFVTTNLNLDWEQKTIDLSSYIGEEIYVAFRYEGTWHTWFVDDVIVGPTSFTDGTLTGIVNPTGVSETSTTEDIIVTLKNFGTTLIEEIDIEWDINGASQPTYNNPSLSLQPGSSIDLNLGSYNFNAPGVYTINADLLVNNDFNTSNNNIQGNFTISEFKDGAIIGVSPEGMSPNTGPIDVKVIIENNYNNLIESAEISWNVDGIGQTTFITSGLNLNFGETTELTIGQFDFTSGVHEITATLNVIGDNSSENNSYTSFAAIDTFWESFEGKVWPPENWSIENGVLDNTNFGDPVHGDKFYSTFAGDGYFGVLTDTIYTPRLMINEGDTFSFYLMRNHAFPLVHEVVWKDGVTGDVHEIETVEQTPNANWTLITVDVSAAQGANHIGVSSTSDASGGSKYDVFTSTAKLHLYDHDIAINNGDMYFLAKKNINESFSCVIRNQGALPVIGSNYTVKLMEAPGVEIASVSGLNLNSWEETTISIPHTFTSIDQHRLYFEVDYNLDENMDNNTFREYDVHVVPNTVVIDEMGPKHNIDLNFPFDAAGSPITLGTDDITQSVYHHQDFENPGDIYGFIYSYDNLIAANDVRELPLKVWISQTELTELSGGYLPNEELVLVFDGIIEILPGNGRELYIPFNQPISYTGIENIVVQNYQYDPEWPPSISRFYSTNISEGEIRTIGSMNKFDLDPLNPGDYYNSHEKTPYTKFVVDPTINYSTLSGTVYNTSNIPLNDATVSIEGTTISVQTDNNGNYAFPDIAYGTYDITATKFGYNDFTSNLILDAPTFEYDFYLTERAQVEVTGTVFGSNNTSIPLELVEVSIEGYINDTTITDTNGAFTFNNVYGDADYEVKLSLYGYYDSFITISVLDQSIDMGDLILEQEFISPFDVTVNTDSNAIIDWNNPLESTKVKLQNDLDVITGSYTNEPFENVWLGNIISISEITTLTSVEIRTDYYEINDGFVTIDVFDVATEEIISSSEVFIIYLDATLTIDIPNIVVYDDIAVMVHWQNNPESTNALAVDNSDTSIENSAVIKYPGGSIELLSDVIGALPYTSFLVRINTLDIGNPDTNNEVLTYNVYRGFANEFPDITNWETINTSPITGNTFEDLDWLSTDPAEQYRFAVETIYTEGESEVTFSNVVDGAVLGLNDNVLDEASIVLYPVPTSDNITISLGLGMQTNEPILAYDTLGRKVLEISPSEIENGMVTKNINHLQSGMYFIKINIDGIIVNKKFIVN